LLYAANIINFFLTEKNIYINKEKKTKGNGKNTRGTRPTQVRKVHIRLHSTPHPPSYICREYVYSESPGLTETFILFWNVTSIFFL
jgi:hypothetical protein